MGMNLKNLKKQFKKSKYYFRECISWSKISSGSIAFRYKPYGHIFDVAGTSIFGESDILTYLLGLNNSKIILEILKAISPTLNFEVGQISQIPVKINNDNTKVKSIVNSNISISKTDWDSFEESWDFEKHPLIKFKYNNSIQESFNHGNHLLKNSLIN